MLALPFGPNRLLAVTIAIAAATSPAFAQGGPAPNPSASETTISATGTGRVDRTPDFVDVSVGIESQDESAAGAQAHSETVMKAAIGAIGKLALAGQELQTGTVDLRPRYNNRPYNDEPPKIIGYTATITIRVRTTDLNSVAGIIDAALKSGANRIDWVQFGIKEAIAAREEAIKLAAQAAKRKAAAMAGALDLRLGRVIEAGTVVQQNAWFGSANRMSNMAQQANEVQAPGDEQAAVVPGKVEVWAEVNVKFAAATIGK